MISVVLAVYNEEKNMTRCLSSVQSFADEIVVVDGNSTDKTVAIAKRFGARVFHTTNKLNFHRNKQLAMKEARGQLIVQLDADEAVDGELAKYISTLEKKRLKGTLTAVAWQIPRKNLFLGKWLTKGGQYPDPVIRVYLTGKAHLPARDVHEQMRVDGTVAWAKGHLLHYANPTFADYMRKFQTYTSFRAQQWYKNGKRPSIGLAFSAWIWQPVYTFVLLYFRHKGFVDGFPGFVFAVMSGLHYPVTYLKLAEYIHQKKQ